MTGKRLWTRWTDRRADRLFRRLSEREIRRRQALCIAQVGLAHASRHDRALHDLRAMERALQREMLRRV